MKEAWKECKLGEVCYFAKDKVSVSELNNDIYISTENMIPNRGGITKATNLPTGEQTPSFESGDILVSNIRPYFKKIWKATFSGGCSADVLNFKAKNNIANDFLYYVLSDDEFFKYCMTTSKGTKMPRGDKVAIFKSWFVDFEPFDGKMPEGWRMGKLSEIADYLNGLAMQKFRPKENENGLPVLKIKELRQGVCDESSELCSPSLIKKEYIIHDGDVIFSWSGSLLVDIWCGETCGLNQHLFKVTSKNYDKWFYYLWTKHHLDKFIFLAADKATTMGHIKREELDKAEVVIPDFLVYNKLNNILQPIIEKIITARVENRKLSYLRDTLLPKLMGGEIEV